jgi:phage terminase large subunit-like protein
MTEQEERHLTKCKEEVTRINREIWTNEFLKLPIIVTILETDSRIGSYISKVVENPEGHCLREQQKIWRFFKNCQRVGLGFDSERVKRNFALIESLKFRQGSGYEGITLSEFQAFDLANVYGWVTRAEDGEVIRQYTRQVDMIPRKVGKSTLAAAMAVVEVVQDGPYDAEVYVASNTYKQAQISFSMIKSALKSLPNDDKRRIQMKINREKVWVNVFEKVNSKWIQTHESTLECVTNPDALDGPNPSMFIIDELAAAKSTSGKGGYAMRNVLRSGQVLRRSPLEVDITTAGNVIDGSFHTEVQESFRPILDGMPGKENDNLFLSLFEPDVGDEESDPHTWAKVNPHYNMLAVVRDFYKSQWKDAQGSSEQMHEFRVKQLNLFVIDESKRWIPAEAVKNRILPFTIEKEDFNGKKPQCALSYDLSVKDDFSCVGYTFFNQPTKQFLVYLEYYLPEGTLKGHINEELYRGWVEGGHLKLTHGDVIDYREIANDILERAAWLDIRKCGFDPFKSAELRNILDNSKELHGRLVPFSQTNGGYNIPMEIFEKMFYSRTDVELPEGMPKYQVLFNANPITPYCFGNAVIDEDSKGNRRPVKTTRHLKIDGTVVTLMGIGEWYSNK